MVQDKVVVIACDDGTVRAVGSPFVAQDIPPWICDLAEKIAGFKATGDGNVERVDASYDELLAYLTPEVKTGNEDFSRLARWRLTMGPQRPGMPRFTSTLADNIERRVDERSMDALFECYDAVPGDPLVVAALSLYWPNPKHGAYLADLVLAIPDAPPLARCFAAGTLIAAGRSDQAHDVMARALADAPDNPQVLRRAAKFHARLLDKDTSVALFEKAIHIEPLNFETRRAYAWALFNMNEPVKAATQFYIAQMIGGNMDPDLIAG
jgi:tetratricopeptide (TPR) repeat protein